MPVVPNEAQWLYVQTTPTAQMTSNTTLEMPSTRDIFGFTDPPNRQHTYLTAYEFSSLWDEGGANSLSADPPSTVLTWFDGKQSRELEVTVNSATVYADGAQASLTYEVTLETEAVPDAQMPSVSFFVDSNTDCVVGSKGPGGGTIFCNGKTATKTDLCFEAAPKTWNSGKPDPLAPFCAEGTRATQRLLPCSQTIGYRVQSATDIDKH